MKTSEVITAHLAPQRNDGTAGGCLWSLTVPLQLTVTWYKINHAGEKATKRDHQNKATSSS